MSLISTYEYPEGGEMIAGPGVSYEKNGPCDLRLEIYGMEHNGGVVVFLDARARAWLKSRIVSFDALNDDVCDVQVCNSMEATDDRI